MTHLLFGRCVLQLPCDLNNHRFIRIPKIGIIWFDPHFRPGKIFQPISAFPHDRLVDGSIIAARPPHAVHRVTIPIKTQNTAAIPAIARRTVLPRGQRAFARSTEDTVSSGIASSLFMSSRYSSIRFTGSSPPVPIAAASGRGAAG